MSGNTFGKIMKVTTWGESHGEAVGVVIDGVPAGLTLTENDVQEELDLRRPGKSEVETSREEKDKVKILSGVFKEKTLGTPIMMVVENKDVDSEPYEKRKNKPRPGHADITYKKKYSHFDYRGGGRSSGRETVGRVAAGAVAKKLLKLKNIEVFAHVVNAGGVQIDNRPKMEDIKKVPKKNSMRCADSEVAEKMKEKVLEARREGDSTGGIVETIALNVPPGLGEPVFDKLEAVISKALMSIGAVKGVEVGIGFDVSDKRGSEVNDDFALEDGEIVTETNDLGGILGGISNGSPTIVRMAVKPPSSISKTQKTVDLEEEEETEIKLEGRHDPNICPRIAPVAESMISLTLADFMFRSGRINPDKVD